MKIFKYLTLFVLLSQHALCSGDLTAWITEVNSPVLYSRPTLKDGEARAGGVARTSMKMAFASVEDFEKLLQQRFPLSYALRNTQINYHRINFTDDLFNFLNGDRPITCYTEGEARLYSRKEEETQLPIFMSFGIFDCVGIDIESPSLCGFMHASTINYKLGKPEFGRLARLLDKFSKDDIIDSSVSLISGGYSELTETVIRELKQKGFTNISIQFGNTICSKRELVKIVSLSDLVPGTTLDQLRALKYIQDAPFTKASIFSMPAMSVYDCKKGQLIKVSTPLLVKNITVQTFFSWYLSTKGGDNIPTDCLPFVKAFFSLVERVPNKKAEELDLLKTAGAIFSNGLAKYLEALEILCNKLDIDLGYHLNLLTGK